MQINKNWSLQRLNSFGFDVRAEFFTSVSTLDDLQEAVTWSRDQGCENFILGGGSNTVFTQNVSGLVIHIAIDELSVVNTPTKTVEIRAGAGLNWHSLVVNTLEKKYFGLENLALIPGSAGAAPIQNIGAYGIELCDVVTSVEVLHQQTGERITLITDDCGFSYRHSVFKTPEGANYIVTAINLALRTDDKPTVNYQSLQDELHRREITNPSAKDVFDCVCDVRTSRLPDPAILGNAGSFFKNPSLNHQQLDDIVKKYPAIPVYQISDNKVKIPAAWLIDQAGWKGYRTGGVGVHDKQALVLVNYGGGNGQQIAILANAIQSDINARFNLELEREPVFY